MDAQGKPVFLVASDDPALPAQVEPAFGKWSASMVVVRSAHSAFSALTSGILPQLVVLDTRLTDASQLLALLRSDDTGRRVAVLAAADAPSEEWWQRLAEGVVEDLVPLHMAVEWWQVRLDVALRSFHYKLTSGMHPGSENDPQDALTGIYGRAAMLSLLFRETDRVQRIGTSLCAILFDVDDFSHWRLRLADRVCEELLVQIVRRLQRLLRSYDLLGRIGAEQFLVAMPGCSAVNAVLLAERIRMEVFGEPFRAGETTVRLTACFAVGESRGRSPVVLMRELNEALGMAKTTGPETIQSAANCPEAQPAPVPFLSGCGEDLIGW